MINLYDFKKQCQERQEQFSYFACKNCKFGAGAQRCQLSIELSIDPAKWNLEKINKLAETSQLETILVL